MTEISGYQVLLRIESFVTFGCGRLRLRGSAVSNHTDSGTGRQAGAVHEYSILRSLGAPADTIWDF